MNSIVGIKNLSQSTTKSGKEYYSFDAWLDGKKFDGKIWDIKDSLESGQIVECDYREDEYNGKKQIIINKYKKYNKLSEGKKASMFGVKFVDKNAILSDIATTFSNFSNNEYKKAGDKALKLYGESLASGFGGASVHHAYKGGLLIHTYDVFKICESIANIYGEDIDRELLLLSAFMHDVGKIFVYDQKGEDVEYNERGYLEDHLYHSGKCVEQIFDKENKEMIMVRHCVLTHHGNREWGAITTPKTLSAFILHLADMIDSKKAIIEEATKSYNGDNQFTDKIYSLGSNILAKMI